MKKIYAANFDLFAPDGAARCKRIHDLCVQYGFTAFVPGYWPGGEQAGEPPTAREIFEEDLRHLEECDIVMACLDPYRGHEPDSGIVWEMGYAYAKGKPVYGYLRDNRPMVESIGGPVDENGFRVEDFGSPVNLMLSCSAKVVQGGPEECLRGIAADMQTE